MFKNSCIIIDIDGCIVTHKGQLSEMHRGNIKLLPGVLDAFNRWSELGYYIIIVTARRESQRKNTEASLSEAGVFWDQILFGLPSGPRYLINDAKPNLKETAIGITIPRNEGLINVKF